MRWKTLFLPFASAGTQFFTIQIHCITICFHRLFVRETVIMTFSLSFLYVQRFRCHRKNVFFCVCASREKHGWRNSAVVVDARLSSSAFLTRLMAHAVLQIYGAEWEFFISVVAICQGGAFIFIYSSKGFAF